jgi:hydroxyacylglutathione hydrolase
MANYQSSFNIDGLQVFQFELGPMQNLQYLLIDEVTRCAALVDPAWDVPFLLSQLTANNVVLDKVLLTHGHHDHVNGLPELVVHYPDIPVYLSEHEASFYTPTVPHLIRTAHNEVIDLGGTRITCLWTPGHTPGGQCFSVRPMLIVGDTLFVNGCGRCDLPGGDIDTLYMSLKFLTTLPDDTVIYPGHSYSNRRSDTLGDQKRTNPYLSKLNTDFFERRFGKKTS